MRHRIEMLSERKLVGRRLAMSFTDNRTAELWKSFMPRRNEVTQAVGVVLYSLQVYGADYFAPFDPHRKFEKWAAVEVSDFNNVPVGMETFIIPPGQYAVFSYKGSSTQGASVFQYIFTTWMPGSGFALDNRPHFEMLGDKYMNNHRDSEEEIWIPVLSQG